MDKRLKSRIFDIIKDKFFCSNISGSIADVSETLPAQIVDGEVLFDCCPCAAHLEKRYSADVIDWINELF